MPMRLTTIRQAVNDLQINLAVQTLELHLDDLNGAMFTHVHIIGERTFTLQGVPVDNP